MKNILFKIGKYIICCLMFCILSFPLINTCVFHLDGPELIGVGNNYQFPEFSIDRWKTGDYQDAFDEAFSKGFSGYRVLMRLYNQIRFDIFSEANNTVVLNDGSIIFKNYIEEYLGLNKDYICTNDYIEQLSNQIKKLSIKASAVGKKVIVLITPSKAQYVEQLIPAKYFKMQRYYTQADRGSNLLIEQLKKEKIDYINSYDVLSKYDNVILFPETGIHWTKEASIIVLNEILKHISEAETDTQQLKIVSRVTDTKPRENMMTKDDDIWSLMNIFSKRNTVYSYPVVQKDNSEGYNKPTILFQGGSFCYTLLESITENDVSEDNNLLFYDISLYDSKENATSLSNVSDETFDHLIEKSEVIILETNEEYVNRMGSGLYPRIEASLSKCSSSLNNFDVSYENLDQEEYANGVFWRWCHSKDANIIINNFHDNKNIKVLFWVPYSGYRHDHPDLPKEIDIAVYLNGRIYSVERCSSDKIFEITINSTDLMKNGKNVISIVTPYTFFSDGKEYSLQVLSVNEE